MRAVGGMDAGRPVGGGARAALEGAGFCDGLPEPARVALAGALERLRFRFGEEIVVEGDEADAFYVLAAGRARVVKRAAAGAEVSLATLKPGSVFGEIALLEGGRRTATVRASEDVEVYRLDRERFSVLVKKAPSVRRNFEEMARLRRLETLLRVWTSLGRLEAPVLRAFVRELGELDVAAGVAVVREGDPPGAMYVVQSGRLICYQGEGEGRRELAYLREGDVFGERAVLLVEPRAATVEAVEPTRLLCLEQAAFEGLLERYPGFRRAIEGRVASYQSGEARRPLDFAAPAGEQAATPGPSAGVGRRGAAAGSPGPAPEPAVGPTDEEPFRSPEGHFGTLGRKRVGRFPFVWQIDQMDCGVACLAMICRYFGRKVGLSRLRALAHTSYDGTSLRGLCRAATDLGLAARAVKVSRRHLDRLPLPAILHWEGNHWVVLLRVERKRVRIADPGLGDRWIPRTELEEKWSGYAGFFDPEPAFGEAPEESLSIRWFLRFLRPYGGTILQAVGLALAASVLGLLVPVFSQVVVDRVVVEGSERLLTIVLVSLLATVAAMSGVSFLQRFLLSHLALRVDVSSLDYVSRALLSLPLGYFQARRTGDIERRLDGLWQVRDFAVGSGIVVLVSVATIGSGLAIMAAYNVQLTLIYAGAVPIYLLLLRWLVKRVRPLFGKLEEQHGRYRSERIDAIRGMEDLKVSASEHVFREKLLKRFGEVATLQLRADLVVQGFRTLTGAVSMTTAALFLWGGAKLVLLGELTIGGLVAFTGLVAMTNGPLLALLSLWDQLQRMGVLLRRLSDVMEEEPEQGRDRARLLPVPTLSGAIEVRNLTLRYGGPESPAILDDVSFSVGPGRRIAIVGRSGSGKTTLLRVLTGLVPPTDGAVYYDGFDLASLRFRDLRRRIGVVSQDPYLFDGSVLENIAFGEEPDLDRATRAARVACAHAFISRMPLGYETRVGETGTLLSGGQRQRLAIARAVYRDPAVLFFDEATSALDAETEQAIGESLGQRLTDVTQLVVAHRLSTVRGADQILVLDAGRLVERGTHDDLMELRGLYFHLVRQQLGV